MKGTATQSSTLAGGATGGTRARDRRRPRVEPAGRHRSAQGHGPVHERRTGSVVGARSRRRAANRHHRAVGRIRRHADRAAPQHPRRQPRPVFVQDGLRLQAPMPTVDVGGDLTIPLQTAAIAMLPGMRGREAETVPLLATLVTRPALRQAALAAHSPHAAGRLAGGGRSSPWPAKCCAISRRFPRRNAPDRPSPRRSRSGASWRPAAGPIAAGDDGAARRAARPRHPHRGGRLADEVRRLAGSPSRPARPSSSSS